ncbi:MerR family transcriptional regulator [Kribbella catacumbae]|uniref:MerR family transcriptional regulator n=1 Tax=Kribbella catacumbae TaxID=460086 RepID=UPI000362740A|nr:MerR family transcriptional regulator [Kribbella catacumbae]
MELWTLGELAERVEAALAGYPGQVNGRVRAVPDQRAIRWYTTTGLVDRPAEMRGRTALYGRRHLLQLVAIKRRQAQGHTLAQIQTELAGATNETLQPIAGLPTDLPEPITTLPADVREPSSARQGDVLGEKQARSRFWSDRVPATPTDAAQPLTAAAAPAGAGSAEVVAAVRVADGVTVVLGQAGVVSDPGRLAAAAGPLVAELVRQGLLPQPSGDES